MSQGDSSLPSQNGKHDEAWMVLKQVHDTNMRAKGHPERVFSVRNPPRAHPWGPQPPNQGEQRGAITTSRKSTTQGIQCWGN